MPETKNEPTLFVDKRHPSVIMTGSRKLPIQVAMISNGNGVLSPEQIGAFTALFAAAPETKRQRDRLLAALKSLHSGKSLNDFWTLLDATRDIIAECESGDAGEAHHA